MDMLKSPSKSRMLEALGLAVYIPYARTGGLKRLASWESGPGPGTGKQTPQMREGAPAPAVQAGPNPKAPCSFMVDTWALKGLQYHDFGVYVY